MVEPAAPPADPIEPVEPVEPIEPAEPVEPTEPTEPVEPTEPTEEEAAAKANEDAVIKKAIEDGKIVEYGRFKEIYGQSKRTERENEELRAAQTPEATQNIPAPVEKPKEDDFESYEEFEDAVADWRLDRRDLARNAERQEADAKTEEADLFKKIGDEVDSAMAKDPDFKDKAFIPEALKGVILKTGHFTEFAYYFGENMDEVVRLRAMPLNEAFMEIGKLAASFKMPKQKTKTNAPTPTKPLGGSTTVSKNPDNMNMAEYKAWRKAGGGT